MKLRQAIIVALLGFPAGMTLFAACRPEPKRIGGATVTSPNMGIVVPVPGVEVGPNWANEIYTAFNTTVDQHDHSPGKGMPITPAGMNINADLDAGSNNVLALRSTRYTMQGSPLSAAGADRGACYVSGNELWYNDESGNQVQITNGGAVVGNAPVYFTSLSSTQPNIGGRKILFLDGYLASGDGGGGLFAWNGTSTANPDACTVAQVTSPSTIVTGRWVRINADPQSFQTAWCGGIGNANFFCTSGNGCVANNFKWYADSGFTTEASDYAVVVARALTAASALASSTGQNATLVLPAGNLYFKTKQTTYTSGTVGNEFVRWVSGVSLRGAGQRATTIRVAPGLNTTGGKGYSTIFGIYDATTPTILNDAEFSDFAADHNAAGNQWAGAAFNSQPNSQIANSLVNFIGGGSNVKIHDVTDLNFNGVFVLELGNYGAAGTTFVTGVSVTNFTVKNPGHDNNMGDNSLVAGGLNGGGVFNSFCIDDSPCATNSTNSCFELHGIGFKFEGNTCNVGSACLTTAGDSLTGSENIISGNTMGMVCPSGNGNPAVGLYMLSQTYQNVQGYIVAGNSFVNGIACARLQNGVQPGTFNNIVFDHNFCTGVGTGGIGGFVLQGASGVPLLPDGGACDGGCAGLGGVTLSNNHFFNLGQPAVYTDPASSTQQITDFVMHGNHIDSSSFNAGATPAVYFDGVIDAGTAQYPRLHAFGNDIKDTRKPPVMSYGFYSRGWLDPTSSVIEDDQQIANAGTANIFIDTSRYPSSGVKYTSKTFQNEAILGDASVAHSASVGGSEFIGGDAGVTGALGVNGLLSANSVNWSATTQITNQSSYVISSGYKFYFALNQALSVTLPAVAVGSEYLLCDLLNNAATWNITVHPASTEHFYPANTTTFTMATNGECATITGANGTNWYVSHVP